MPKEIRAASAGVVKTTDETPKSATLITPMASILVMIFMTTSFLLVFTM